MEIWQGLNICEWQKHTKAHSWKVIRRFSVVNICYQWAHNVLPSHLLSKSWRIKIQECKFPCSLVWMWHFLSYWCALSIMYIKWVHNECIFVHMFCGLHHSLGFDYILYWSVQNSWSYVFIVHSGLQVYMKVS